MNRNEHMIKGLIQLTKQFNWRLELNKALQEDLYKQYLTAKTPKDKKELNKQIKEVSMEIEAFNKGIKYVKQEIDTLKESQRVKPKEYKKDKESSYIFWVILGVLGFFMAICIGLTVALHK